MEDIKCIGCGATLQSTDKEKAGYIPKSGLTREDAICQRCYRLKHYNEVMNVDVSSGDFLTMLNSLYETSGVIVKVIDVFDFNGSIIPSFNRIVGDKKVIAAVNKIDLLPKSVNRNRLLHRAKNMLKQEGITATETVAISALKGNGMSELMDTVSKYASSDDVYVVGTTNVGKSTLINQLIKYTTGEGEVITTSRFPGTTLDLIDIPLGEDRFIFDTPGVVIGNQMTHFVSEAGLKYITPSREIKPKTYQLNAGQTLFIGNLARMDYVSGDKNSFSVYAAHQLNIHRTKTENAGDFYDKHYNGLLAPPEISGPALKEDGRRFTFKVTEDSDILISGLTFISVTKGATIDVTVPAVVDVIIRATIFKGGV